MADGRRDFDRAAWIRAALDRYGDSLTRYAAHLLGNADLARDVVQDAFAKLCAEDPADLDGRLTEWLYAVCRHRALDLKRKDRRMQALSDAQAAAGECRDPAPDAAAERRESTGRMLHLLARLPENQREVVRLRFQNGLSYKEISAVTELSVSHVGVLIHTAIRSLREQMG